MEDGIKVLGTPLGTHQYEQQRIFATVKSLKADL